MDQLLAQAAKTLEAQLDSEIDRLDNLTVDDIDAIREKRLKEMKERQEKIIKWKANVRRKTKLSLLIFDTHTLFFNFKGHKLNTHYY